MRKQSLFTVFIVAACSLFVVMAFYAFTCYSTSTDICNVATDRTEQVKDLGGKMLWESLTSQFVSSVQY